MITDSVSEVGLFNEPCAVLYINIYMGISLHFKPEIKSLAIAANEC